MSRCVIVGGADMGNYGHIRLSMTIRKWNSFRRSLFPFLTAMIIFLAEYFWLCQGHYHLRGEYAAVPRLTDTFMWQLGAKGI